jgi:hypothetical protein
MPIESTGAAAGDAAALPPPDDGAHAKSASTIGAIPIARFMLTVS